MPEKRIKIITISGEIYFPYQLRVDCSAAAFMVRDEFPGDVSSNHIRAHYYTSPFYNYLKNNFTYFMVGEEVSENHKPHWQCFLLNDEEIDDKTRVAMRNLIKRRYSSLDTKQPVSLKKSFAPSGLFKYVQKEGHVFYNMPEFILVHLEKMHKKRLQKLGSAPYQKVKDIAKKATNFPQFIYDVVNAIKNKSLTKVPRKTIMWKLALQQGLVTREQFVQEFYSYHGDFSRSF